MNRADFLNDPNIELREGDAGESVEVLQRLLLEMGFDPHGIDGKFGRLTERALIDYQWARMLHDSGVAGPPTRNDLANAVETGWYPGQPFQWLGYGKQAQCEVPIIGGYHMAYGRIPARDGRMSTFGGPDDAGDRIYGQALVPAKTAADVYQNHPGLVALGLFSEGHTDPLPMTTDWKGRRLRAGVSYMLNPDSYYVAMRWDRGRYPDPLSARVVLMSVDGRVCVCAPTDYGPAVRTRRVIDISPRAEDVLGVKTDSVIGIAWGIDGASLGPV